MGCKADPLDNLKILLVDDDLDFQDLLGEVLGRDHAVLSAHDARSAVELYERYNPDVVLLDINLGEGQPDGFTVLESLLELDPDLAVIFLSQYHHTATVVRAMKAGAVHCLDKPPDYEELSERIRQAAEARRQALELQVHRLPPFRFLGDGNAMEQVRRQAHEAARSDLPVLILGETGTGKSLLAKCIHLWSEVRSGPFRDINVAALPDALLDSELFGHEKGAFTNAVRRHRGLFELASGGSILLDEIGDLPAESQVKLLKVVEEKRIRRLGSEDDQAVSVRIISATSGPRRIDRGGNLPTGSLFPSRRPRHLDSAVA